MPEGDTIHRIARRMNAAFDGREIGLADAPSPRSPIHNRAAELRGRTFGGAEARGKHLLVHFSGGVVLHSHLGMNGRWRVSADGRAPPGRPWIRIGSGPAVAAQTGGKLLRLVSESRARNDPGLLQLGPDPLRPGFDVAAAARRLLQTQPSREVGDALLDQRLIAGIGNAIRNEACFAAAVSPFRRVGELEAAESFALVQEARRIMLVAVETGRRPHQVYRAERRPCPRCGGRIAVRAQGDDGRAAYWCPGCQR
ncbi:MAG: Fpg/Nei family DNA glycosylase [Solirubrobacterales bacterium]